MSVHFSELAHQIAGDGEVTSQDIAALRRLGWASGNICRDEAEAIFALNRQLTRPLVEWTDFFVEAIGEFVINGTPPKGHVHEREAEWLIGALDRDGRLESMAELELLVRVMERAANVPDTLKHYAIGQIEKSVLTGTGPTRCGGELSDTHVTAAECRLLRRMIFAGAGMRPGAVHRQEAEMLFRLKDATLGHENAPEWKRLFVQGVGNYLMGFSSPSAQLSHERALELEAFLSDHSASVGRFVGQMAKSAPRSFDTVFGKRVAEPGRTQLAAAAGEIEDHERQWLDSRIGDNGQVDEFDQALLDFIDEEMDAA